VHGSDGLRAMSKNWVVIFVVLSVFAVVPLAAILAVNTVFSQEIAYSFNNWFWMLVLLLLFGNYGRPQS
jgi:hypothetical protein